MGNAAMQRCVFNNLDTMSKGATVREGNRENSGQCESVRVLTGFRLAVNRRSLDSLAGNRRACSE